MGNNSTSVCSGFYVYISNGSVLNNSLNNLGSAVSIINQYSKITLVKTDNSLFTFNLGTTSTYGNYSYKMPTCNNSLFQQFYATPSIIKEIRLHN